MEKSVKDQIQDEKETMYENRKYNLSQPKLVLQVIDYSMIQDVFIFFSDNLNAATDQMENQLKHLLDERLSVKDQERKLEERYRQAGFLKSFVRQCERKIIS